MKVRLMRKEIILNTKRGFCLHAFDGDSITNEVKKYGEYDSNTLNSLEEILEKIKPNISLDIGANIGNHTFYSLTCLDNKKAHPKNLKGFLSRLFFKLITKKWCLGSFDQSKFYSNVFLVPERYNSKFKSFRFAK